MVSVMDTSEVRVVLEGLLKCNVYPGSRRMTAPTIDAANDLLVRLATEPNLHALFIQYGRALYELEDANEALRKFNDAARHLPRFSVFSGADRQANPAWHHRCRVQWNAQLRVNQLGQQLRDLARAKAVVLYNQQHPLNPRA